MGKKGNIAAYFKRQRTEDVQDQEQHLPLLLELQQPPPEHHVPLLELEQRQEAPQENEASADPVIFRGIEFLERDPGLRPQIWRYPPEQRDRVRRAYLTLGPMQPRLKHYEGSGKIGQQRRFRYNWFSLFPSWLEYSQENHRAYCLFCFVSSRNMLAKGGSDVFSVHGFEKWKKVNDGKACAFLGHVGSGQNVHFQVTLPVSTASAERAFSSLKIIKTRLRNKMGDVNLANNLVVHIEREIAEKYDFVAVLAEFKSKGDRKADL